MLQLAAKVHSRGCRYANVLAEMLHQIKEFNQKNNRGIDGGNSSRGSLVGSILQMALSEAVGGGGGGSLLGTLAGRAKGQARREPCCGPIVLCCAVLVSVLAVCIDRLEMMEFVTKLKLVCADRAEQGTHAGVP